MSQDQLIKFANLKASVSKKANAMEKVTKIGSALLWYFLVFSYLVLEYHFTFRLVYRTWMTILSVKTGNFNNGLLAVSF